MLIFLMNEAQKHSFFPLSIFPTRNHMFSQLIDEKVFHYNFFSPPCLTHSLTLCFIPHSQTDSFSLSCCCCCCFILSKNFHKQTKSFSFFSALFCDQYLNVGQLFFNFKGKVIILVITKYNFGVKSLILVSDKKKMYSILNIGRQQSSF